MELNENADLEGGQVEDVGGSGGGGGGFGGIPIPIGGGRLGLIITAIVVVGGLCVGGGLGTNILGGGNDSGQSAEDLNARCARSNASRFDDPKCRNWLYVQSIQTYWRQASEPTFGVRYVNATTRYFSGQVSTGCGNADAGVGPFYCPEDDHVYIDLSFYDELTNRFGARGAFAQPYVLAHEYGHHMQDLNGTEQRMRQLQQRDQANANHYSVMLELQADCLAGAWAKHASDTTDAKGEPLFKSITEQDIADAVNTAGQIGDDTIQEQSGQGIDQDKFTHGSSAQRKQWFQQGYSTGDGRRCDTFNGSV